MPPGIVDRAADCWEPLLAIADLAGGDWPEDARNAALELNKIRAEDEPSWGVKLLSDIREVFLSRSTDRYSSAALCQLLAAMPEQPWGDLYGRAIKPRTLAKRLRPFDIKSKQIRLDGEVRAQGFHMDDFRDAWSRYLPTLPQEGLTFPDSSDTLDPD